MSSPCISRHFHSYGQHAAMSPTVPFVSPPKLLGPFSALEDCDFSFVGEGASNVVFEVRVPPSKRGSISSKLFEGNLLRVPKAGTKAYSYEDLHAYWETVVKPLFEPQNLVQHQLILLGGEAVIRRLNSILEKEDATRRADFRGSRVAMAKYGMLIEDMRQRHPDDLTFEFKPKWLAQSPSAPPTATRCRNCAREALKRHANPDRQPKSSAILCPLDFRTCATSPISLANVLNHLTPRVHKPTANAHPPSVSLNGHSPASPRPTPSQSARLRHWLQTNTLLPRLRQAQLANDGLGPLGADASDPHFQLAMTLRDCTCFVRVPANPELPIEAKLADLDKKNWMAKMEYWRAMEQKLIEGGYYEGKEVPRMETGCVLERERGWMKGIGEQVKEVKDDDGV